MFQNLPKVSLKLLPPCRAVLTHSFVWAEKCGKTAELKAIPRFSESNHTNLLMHRQSKCQTNEIPAYVFKGEVFRLNIINRGQGGKLQEVNKSLSENIFLQKLRKERKQAKSARRPQIAWFQADCCFEKAGDEDVRNVIFTKGRKSKEGFDANQLFNS